MGGATIGAGDIIPHLPKVGVRGSKYIVCILYPSNRGCFVNLPLPKAYYLSFCSEKNVLYEEPPVSSVTVTILGFGCYASTKITILRKITCFHHGN